MSEQTVERGKVRKMTMCALFTALIVVGAFYSCTGACGAFLRYNFFLQ